MAFWKLTRNRWERTCTLFLQSVKRHATENAIWTSVYLIGVPMGIIAVIASVSIGNIKMDLSQPVKPKPGVEGGDIELFAENAAPPALATETYLYSDL